jgi:universal stress protein A
MLACDKILYPTDFSSAAVAAFDAAQRLARDSDSLLLIVHVVEPVAPPMPGTVSPPVTLAGTDLSYPQERAIDEAHERIRKVIPEDPAIRFEHRVLEGVASDGILKLVEEEQADLIVMGTHGRTGVKRLLMGSVVEKVVRRAPCPVLTLRQSASAFRDSGVSSSGD